MTVVVRLLDPAFRWLLLVACGAVAFPVAAERPSPQVSSTALPKAHAHNDYRHARPLLDALQHGFCSVEADIFLVDGELRVGHDRDELKPGRTLESLYLQPLQRRVRRNRGSVYGDGTPVMLLVDIKTDGPAVYEVLRRTLSDYEDTVGGLEDGVYKEGAVQVVISGDRPKEQIASDASRRVGIDGRLSDLDSEVPANLMPLISDRWTSHFEWRGEGDFPAAERDKLHSIVRRAHSKGRRVRFWATPENEAVWRELVTAGVDHINTDQLERLESFLSTTEN